MTEAQPPRRIGRSILAVLAGMVVGVAITLVTDEILSMERSCWQRSIAPSMEC
jgi:hypothetical protein